MSDDDDDSESSSSSDDKDDSDSNKILQDNDLVDDTKYIDLLNHPKKGENSEEE